MSTKSRNGNTRKKAPAKQHNDRMWTMLLDTIAEESQRNRCGATDVEFSGTCGSKQNEFGETMLHLAAGGGDDETVHAIVTARAPLCGAAHPDLDLPNRYGMTPLHLAAARGHAKVCKLLIAAGANIRAKTSDGRTPFDLAVKPEARALLEAHTLSQRGESLSCRRDLAI